MTKTEFESAVREHQGMVYSIACNFFHNAALAEEIAQDVFLQLYEGRLSVKTGPHCVAWLRRSTMHRCIDALRLSLRKPVYAGSGVPFCQTASMVLSSKRLPEVVVLRLRAIGDLLSNQCSVVGHTALKTAARPGNHWFTKYYYFTIIVKNTSDLFFSHMPVGVQV